uniref:Uncharacterized protein n=1 Tax=Cyanothece sp. (strain PCC 7425 / ATCC 29141) TaxID=395961 RepID=B8HQC3_CYAP4
MLPKLLYSLDPMTPQQLDDRSQQIIEILALYENIEIV